MDWIGDDYQRKIVWVMSKQDLINDATNYVSSNAQWNNHAHIQATGLAQAAGLQMVPQELITQCYLDLYFAGNDTVLNKVKAQWRSHKHDKNQTRQVSVSEDVYKAILNKLKPHYGATSVSSTIEFMVREALENQKFEKHSAKILKIKLGSTQVQLSEANRMISVLNAETSKKIAQLKRIAHELIYQKEVLLKRIMDAGVKSDGIDVSPQMIMSKDIERKLSELEAYHSLQKR